MKSIWEFLSGKKMIIGLFLLALIGQSWFLDILPDGTTENAIVWILEYVGLLLTGAGATHKIVKWKQEQDTLKDYK